MYRRIKAEADATGDASECTTCESATRVKTTRNSNYIKVLLRRKCKALYRVTPTKQSEKLYHQ